MAQHPLCLKLCEGASMASMGTSRCRYAPHHLVPTPRIMYRTPRINLPGLQRCRDESGTRASALAREIPAEVSAGADSLESKKKKKGLETDPAVLWQRYVEWLYQHKELGLYVDVSRIGFTEEFVEEMEPKFQRAFKAMKELEAGAIANPDEGRMVGHYWLRDSKRTPNPFLKQQIDSTLDAICNFAENIISGKGIILC